MLELYQPREEVEGTVVLDEPFKWLDSTRVDRAAEFLAAISKRFNRQFVVTAHENALASYADRRFHLELIGDKTRVTLVSEKDFLMPVE